MIRNVSIVVVRKSKLLLSQCVLSGPKKDLWCFPRGEILEIDIDLVAACHRILYDELCIHGMRFGKMFDFCHNNCVTHFFMCDRWSGDISIVDCFRRGFGWFSFGDLHQMEGMIDPVITKNIMYIAYLVQHYKNNIGRWKMCNKNGPDKKT